LAEKYGYLYSERELGEIAGKAAALNGQAERVYLKLNNTAGTTRRSNEIQLKEMLLEDWHPPDRDRLVAEIQRRQRAGKAG
jgi:uncharacterized protein YecE (DUF72 family)